MSQNHIKNIDLVVDAEVLHETQPRVPIQVAGRSRLEPLALNVVGDQGAAGVVVVVAQPVFCGIHAKIVEHVHQQAVCDEPVQGQHCHGKELAEDVLCEVRHVVAVDGPEVLDILPDHILLQQVVLSSRSLLQDVCPVALFSEALDDSALQFLPQHVGQSDGGGL
jgi:hypothetical protein